MNQHASKNSVPPSVGADVSGIETLLNRNLKSRRVRRPVVQGKATRRRRRGRATR
jgi:hypothetical protein